MTNHEIKVVPIKKHNREDSPYPCTSFLAELRGGLLICVCCSSSIVEATSSFNESVAGAIADSPIPKTIFAGSTPK